MIEKSKEGSKDMPSLIYDAKGFVMSNCTIIVNDNSEIILPLDTVFDCNIVKSKDYIKTTKSLSYKLYKLRLFMVRKLRSFINY